MTHDYGTTTLFAALNVLKGTVFGRCMQRHTHQEFIRFLNAVERVEKIAIRCVSAASGVYPLPQRRRASGAGGAEYGNATATFFRWPAVGYPRRRPLVPARRDEPSINRPFRGGSIGTLYLVSRSTSATSRWTTGSCKEKESQ